MNSVKIISVDKDFIFHWLKHYLDTKIKNSPDVKRVYLFGSYANGTYLPSSDIDLVIVLKSSNKNIIDRIPDFIPDKFPVGCDVIPVTEEELEEQIRKGNKFFEDILFKGKLLFTREKSSEQEKIKLTEIVKEID